MKRKTCTWPHMTGGFRFRTQKSIYNLVPFFIAYGLNMFHVGLLVTMEGKLFFGRYLIWVVLLLGQMYGYKSCILKERKALLELKKYIISKSYDSGLVLPNSTTWTNDTKSDCCQWKGVECNGSSGLVIKLFVDAVSFYEMSFLNLSLLHPFEELRSLNLLSGQSDANSFKGFFDDVEGYKSLRRLKHLETMDLSYNTFTNNIFPFFSAASSLTTLFLRGNSFDGPFPIKELSHLKKLKALDLSLNNFSCSMELQELKSLINLELLNLSLNRLNGSISELKSLTNLELLNLSGNKLNGSMSELMNLTKLELLNLAWNGFSGPIAVVCEMKNLRELDLRGNNFVGQLPLCVGSLKKLVVLDLSFNQLSGNIPSTLSGLQSLEYLSLLDHNFTGLLSLNPLTNLTKLKVLKFSSTSDTIQVVAEGSWQPKFQLSVAILRFCKLKKIPFFLVYQKNLRLVDLSSNRLSRHIPTWLLANNPQLEVLQLRNNSFTILHMPTILHNNLQVLDISANRITGMISDDIGRLLPSLVHMNVSNNGFQGYFPSSMSEMTNITFLDLSYNNFTGELPRSFLRGCFSLKLLKLSHNKFSGNFFTRRTCLTSLEVCRIDNNLITGKIGVGLLNSTGLSLLDMSNNFLKGVIPSWISKFSGLDFLLLSNNFLEGTVPSSLMNLPSLLFLDLSENLLSGDLLSVYGGSAIILFLHNNNFTRPIPDTLLKGVQILDMRNNKLSGSIPQFVNVDLISILLLSGNNLTGSIPRQLCDLRNIRLLDLSDNKFNGLIPSCFYNLSFGQRGEKYLDNYQASISTLSFHSTEYYRSTFMVEEFHILYSDFQKVEIKFTTKRRHDSYSPGEPWTIDPYSTREYLSNDTFKRGILDYMFGMDLSNNELSGEIPTELGDLLKLRALNLSHNSLSDFIPSSFSNLKDIESLDLSYNMLHGSIPQQLTSLTSLVIFNVSYNNLSGIIPQERQFNTFNENNYIGNHFLCGPPTNISCGAKKNLEEATNGGKEEENGGAIDLLVLYYSTASGFVTALIGIVVLMCFDCPWRRAWFRTVETLIASTKNMWP